jgi:TonB family protein
MYPNRTSIRRARFGIRRPARVVCRAVRRTPASSVGVEEPWHGVHVKWHEMRWPCARESISATIVAGCLLAVAVSGQGFAPKKIKDVRPVYPRESLQAGDEGMVILELTITTSGAVGDVVILWSECQRLEQAALTAVRQWRYEPARLNGEPVPFRIVVELPFRLPPRFKARASRIGACKWTNPPKRIHQ